MKNGKSCRFVMSLGLDFLGGGGGGAVVLLLALKHLYRRRMEQVINHIQSSHVYRVLYRESHTSTSSPVHPTIEATYDPVISTAVNDLKLILGRYTGFRIVLEECRL